ncbi:hypothetical protein IV203_020647 [Nitzschia inconspicua]|uniref:Uncharacterized protein n=1 Tax=Nitzschia inconspicua TaxID=303405 RepID=A0A9K3K7K1_9STRA|nr:hypothetical protein IV203_034422 [Nitzschia inconspicua]KAG7342703.1 hypothetical protein IV203_020647 [Nitzschia inconspicua]
MKLFVSFATLAALVAVLDVVAAKKYSYRSTGLGGSATMYSEKCGEWPFGSYLDVYTSQYTYKVNAKGKPETSPAPYWFPYLYIWLECTDGTATKIEIDWDWFDSTPSTFTFPSNNKLQTGLVSGSFLGRKLSCTIVPEMYDEEYPSYDCDYENVQSVSIDLSVTWTGIGSTEQSKYTVTSRSDDYYYRYSYKGTSRDATFDVTLKVEGVPVDLSSSFGGWVDKYSSLYKSTSSSMDRYVR